MSHRLRGILAMAAACAVWGLSPLYYHALAEVPPLEVLAHRTLWSLLFFGLVLAAQGRLGALPPLLRGRALALTALAAVTISSNWFFFIFSVQTGHTVESSLGYYIFPLVSVLLGLAVFGERLDRLQALAVAIATLAVAQLAWRLGAAPWLSLFLAASFGLYGVLKKRIAAGPVVSVTAEVAVLSPLALVWLLGLHAGLWHESAASAVFGRDPGESLLLAGSGVLTGGPLILMSYASRRITMAELGLTQYLNPTLQFLCAVLVFAEPVSGAHLLAFAMIWAALALYSVAAFRQDRAARRAETRAGTSGISVM